MALIKGKQLANGAIVEAKLADGAVTVNKIPNSTITADKLNISGQAWDLSEALSVSVPAPWSSAHAATKGYVDAVQQGLDVKASVRLATTAALENWDVSTANKTLTAPTIGATTIDNVAIAADNRILVKNQSSGVENGIYVVTTAGDGSTATVLTRADDFNTDAKVTPGAFTFVEEGSTNSDTGWVLSTNATITLDTTALTFTQFSSAGAVNAGDGLGKTGNDLFVQVKSDGGLEITSDELNIKLKNSSVLTDASGLEVGLNAEGSIAIKGGAGLAAPVMRPQAGLSVASNISTDDTDTGLALSASPAAGGFVQVLINGVMIELGDGVKTGDGYFTGDNGTTARAHHALVSGDKFFWNGSSVFALETSDRVDFIYASI